MADELASWARERGPELLARAEAEVVAALRDALIDAALAERGGGISTRPPLRQAAAEAAPEAAPERGVPSGEGFWAYCVLRVGEPLPDNVQGVHGASALERVEAGGLAAVVSRVPLAEFGAVPLRENLNDLA